MQNQPAPRAVRRIAEGAYRERLAPSLKIIAGAAIVAPMVSLVFVRIDALVALALGLGAAVALIALLVGLAPVVTVSDGVLRAGRAHIDVSLLGDPRPLEDDEARSARGVGLDPKGWYLIRGGIAGIVFVPNDDPDDPVRSWTISTRTPDRLAAAIRRAQRA
ncbi:DUF3093 family protein [Microbacterium karelineae]|uniref:DUF3093 family protein n=1 Tax=Microbacterium karelineae TaxID=2654283 RepID=UPI0012E9A0D8|nr:DUF3093 family protein [Microbacterium karelineae]